MARSGSFPHDLHGVSEDVEEFDLVSVAKRRNEVLFFAPVHDSGEVGLIDFTVFFFFCREL